MEPRYHGVVQREKKERQSVCVYVREREWERERVRESKKERKLWRQHVLRTKDNNTIDSEHKA